jgi:hypothetical protein
MIEVLSRCFFLFVIYSNIHGSRTIGRILAKEIRKKEREKVITRSSNNQKKSGQMMTTIDQNFVYKQYPLIALATRRRRREM